MILTGADGQLKYNNNIVAKVRNWQVNVSRAQIDSTTLGVFDSTYVVGLRGATGQCSIFFDPSDQTATAFLNTIWTQNNDETVQFVFDRNDTDGDLEGTGFITSIGTTVSVGEAQACEIQFQFSGPVNGTF